MTRGSALLTAGIDMGRIDPGCLERGEPLAHPRPRLLRRSGGPAEKNGERHLRVDFEDRARCGLEPIVDLEDLPCQGKGLRLMPLPVLRIDTAVASA